VKRFLRYHGLIKDDYVDGQFLPKVDTLHDNIVKDRYKDLIDKHDDMKLSLIEFERKYGEYNKWRLQYSTIPELLLRYKYLNKTGDELTIPNNETIKDYMKKVKLLREQIKNKTNNEEIPKYDEFITNHPKINKSSILPINHRTQWYMYGKKEKPIEYSDTVHDTAYDLAIKKWVNYLLKVYPESKSIFNNIHNICCLTFNDLERIEKILKENSNDINLLFTTGVKYNNKINERMTNDYGFAIAILKDLLKNYPNQLDQNTTKFIENLNEKKLSRVVSANINFIIQNRNNLLNLTNILKENLDTTNMSSFDAYGPNIDLISLYDKPVGYTKSIEYDQYERKRVDELYDKHKEKIKADNFLGWFRYSSFGQYLAPLCHEEKLEIENDTEEKHYKGTDVITIVKNDEKELSFKSESKGLVYTILKKNKPKLKRAIKINNELIPIGKSEVNEYQDGIHGDITTTKYQLNEQEITVEKRVEKPIEMKNQNKSMEIYEKPTTPINVMQDEAWEHSHSQMKQNGYNQACNTIQPNLTMHDIQATPM